VAAVTKSIEECEEEFAREVRRFIDLAIEQGYSVDEAKAMARDVVAQAVRKSFKVVKDDPANGVWPAQTDDLVDFKCKPASELTSWRIGASVSSVLTEINDFLDARPFIAINADSPHRVFRHLAANVAPLKLWQLMPTPEDQHHGWQKRVPFIHTLPGTASSGRSRASLCRFGLGL
jgi:hypothetical protein